MTLSVTGQTIHPCHAQTRLSSTIPKLKLLKILKLRRERERKRDVSERKGKGGEKNFARSHCDLGRTRKRKYNSFWVARVEKS